MSRRFNWISSVYTLITFLWRLFELCVFVELLVCEEKWGSGDAVFGEISSTGCDHNL